MKYQYKNNGHYPTCSGNPFRIINITAWIPRINRGMTTRILSLLFLVMTSVSFSASAQDFRPSPEIATGAQAVSKAIGEEFMISTANLLATQAGYEILKKGGTAADAAITAQLVLGLVEPQSSGLGGGAFALYYDAKMNQLSSWDGRETAPHSATFDMFLDDQGQPIPFWDAVVGPQSVGVPGTPKLLETLHHQFGKTEWANLFEVPIDIAERGFKISPRLQKMIDADKGKLDRFETAHDYFYGAGDVLKNPDYAQTLGLFQKLGASIFYNPDILGGHIIQATNERINADDLKKYRVIKRNPICGDYREYKICSMGEPSSGALTILQALKILEPFELKHDNAKTIHRIAEASKMAFADRNMYMADPNFVGIPGTALLNVDYIDKRRALMNDKAQSYDAGDISDIFKAQANQVEEGTTHIVAVDKHGNAISMTSTIESAFGSKIMTNGFLLNNEMTDFSFMPERDGKAIANRIEPGKRPRSSMAPTIVFDKDGEPILLIGSAGGSRIIGYVLHRLIAILDWNMDVAQALAMPSFLDRGNGLESEIELPSLLSQKGHDVQVKELGSGLTAIQIKNGVIVGAADPRREGLAKGE
jgi:gamma-glutamyltranspeptidase/glutathione hydrolase